MARSYTECKSSCQEDYITAFNWLKKCKELTGTYEVDEFYFKLENDISKYKLDEKKVFKSFFRKINTERAGQEIEQPKQNEIGKPQLAFLNLVIDNCTKLSIQLNGIKAKEKEWNEIEECKKTALFYKKTLEDLVGLDFDNPNEFILSFCKENGADYKDKQVQDSFIKIRDEYIEKINVFYEKNLNALFF